MAERFPEHIALAPDPGIRRSAGGRTLLGGSPPRLLRFTDAGAAAVDRVLAGGEVPPTGADAAVARRLLDAGLAHPRPLAVPAVTVSVVVPVRDDPAGVAALLDRLAPLLVSDTQVVLDPQVVLEGGRIVVRGIVVDEIVVDEIVVVDDGSVDPDGLRAAVAGRATVVRHDRSLGPGAARDTGWRAATGEVVAFVDADVVPADGWLAPLLGHLLDPTVGLVAPRVRSRPGPSALERYERHRSPLDLGPAEARVAPRARVSYIPTAALVCRRQVLQQLGGFDPGLRVGEDVDLVWRAVEAGWAVRYEPASEVEHRPRPSWARLLRQRIAYGSAAAALERRHPGDVAPVELNAWTLGAWGLAALAGRRGAVAGAAVAAGSSLALAPQLRDRVDDPVRTALRLGGLGTLHAGTWLARSVWRAWLPLALAAAVPSRRVRRLLVATAVVPAVIDHRAAAEPVELDVLRWTAAHAADQAAYCTGVWLGAWRERSLAALRPRLSGFPGLARRSGKPVMGG